ncbi:unnamed protein product, partial [Toxocara canis]|uniref:RecQ-mediated genome instability protein 1 n=1 Tax=Toxocara canis TaxID=6265 RepID=A0A183VEG1_TOXCA
MEVTDGQRRLRAISMGDIDGLSVKCSPGMKIYLFSDVQCRRNVLMLNESNTQVLGGDIDALCDTNATLRVMARRLNIDENKVFFSLHRTKRATERTDECTGNEDEMGIGEAVEATVARRGGTDDIGMDISSKQTSVDLNEELGKDDVTETDLGAKTIAVTTNSRDDTPVDTTIQVVKFFYPRECTMSSIELFFFELKGTFHSEAVKLPLATAGEGEVLGAAAAIGLDPRLSFGSVQATSDAQKTTDDFTLVTCSLSTLRLEKAEQDGHERASTISVQNGIALTILPHKLSESATIDDEKGAAAKEHRSDDCSAWNKQTLSRTTLNEMYSKLKGNNKKKRNGELLGMRCITSYFAPVRKLKTSQPKTVVVKPPLDSNAPNDVSAAKAESVEGLPRTQGFQSISGEAFSRSFITVGAERLNGRQFLTHDCLVRSSSRPVHLLEDVVSKRQIPAHEATGNSSFRHLPEPGNVESYEQVQRSEDVSQSICRQVPPLRDLDRPGCNGTAGLDCVARSDSFQLQQLEETSQSVCLEDPALKNSGRLPYYRIRAPDSMSRSGNGQLQSINESSSRLSQVFQKASSLGRISLSTITACQRPGASASKKISFVKLSRPRNGEIDSSKANVERQAQIGQILREENYIQSNVERQLDAAPHMTRSVDAQPGFVGQAEASQNAIGGRNTQGSSIVLPGQNNAYEHRPQQRSCLQLAINNAARKWELGEK